MNTIISKINAATAQDGTGSPAARLAGAYLDRIEALSRRAKSGGGRFASWTCGSDTAAAIAAVCAMVPDIKAAGLRGW